jgi:hypothetical protein
MSRNVPERPGYPEVFYGSPLSYQPMTVKVVLHEIFSIYHSNSSSNPPLFKHPSLQKSVHNYMQINSKLLPEGKVVLLLN